MARDDRWGEQRDRDFQREAPYRHQDYRRGPVYGRSERDRWETGYGEDERAYRPFGANGPTAYYNEPDYGYSDRGRYDESYGYGGRSGASAWRRDEPEYGYHPDRYAPAPREGRGDEPRTWVDKTRDEVASWFGDHSAERRRHRDEMSAGEHRGRGPKDYRRSDERIREDVNDRLTDDPYLDATDIVVTVQDAEVTLGGYVTAREDKRRAERLAEQVPGVGDVQNNVRLRPDEGRASTADIPTAGNF